ncbi:MAG: hypothetical protein KKF48_03285 [Nanoarchaeota archaeon]|nr:hypothetical protein [Nanoarchaeota archaeon]MBU1028042.1 hypothetical protein [Nanoarchaeota archaeon]
MRPSEHIFLGIIFSLFLFIFFPKIGFIGFLLIFLSTVLIDIDHYVYYVYKKRDLSLKKARKWNLELGKKCFYLIQNKKQKNFHGVFCFFHGIEIIIIMFFLSIFSRIFLFISLGLTFHLLLDIYSEYRCIGRVTSKFSLIVDIIRNKKTEFIEDYQKC